MMYETHLEFSATLEMDFGRLKGDQVTSFTAYIMNCYQQEIVNLDSATKSTLSLANFLQIWRCRRLTMVVDESL